MGHAILGAIRPGPTSRASNDRRMNIDFVKALAGVTALRVR
jgi:hypothetical protein